MFDRLHFLQQGRRSSEGGYGAFRLSVAIGAFPGPSKPHPGLSVLIGRQSGKVMTTEDVRVNHCGRHCDEASSILGELVTLRHKEIQTVLETYRSIFIHYLNLI